MRNKVCIIIPAYNEAKRILVREFVDFANSNQSYHLLFVNDGSTDDTSDVIENFSKDIHNISLFNCERNKGKANAVRDGMLFAKQTIESEYYMFLDADLSTPLSEIRLLLNEIESNDKLMMVFGSRILKVGSEINRKTYRHYTGRIVATCISVQLGLPIYDTQCGAKLFKAEIVNYLFEKAFISRWLFDVEIFNRLLLKYPKQEVLNIIKEIPLTTWTDIDGSKLGMKDVLKTPLDLLKISFHYKK